MTLDGYLAAARLVAGVPRFLRHRLGVAEARAILERRRRSRAADFLALARAAVYDHGASPYRALLAAAGCAYGDLAALVEREGLDAALATLLRAGVYVTVEELKGRRPIVRGSVVIETRPRAFENPALHRHDLVRTSGSRGTPAAVPFTLEFFEDVVVDMRLTLDAWGPGPWSLAYWDVPGGMTFFLLTYPRCGVIPERWFSPVNVADPAVASRYRWSARALRWAARAARVRLPAPETVPVTAPLEIARWMSASLASGATPLLLTYPSPAVRLWRAAAAAGIDLTGAQLRLYGEPLTAARLDVIRRSGAEARAIYATMEVFRVGDPCLRPEAVDEVHVFDDLHALIQVPADARVDVPPGALLVTSLRGSAPVILLNASLGDRATVSTRPCGCALQALGWTTHLSDIRSYEKLTASGMTFLDADVIRVLDVTLPARFGGGPTDYQLVEDEDGEGRPRIRLLVHPAIGDLDADEVSRAFLDALGTGAGGGPALMARLWDVAGVVTVERRPPFATATGKIHHVHARPRAATSGAGPSPGGP